MKKVRYKKDVRIGKTMSIKEIIDNVKLFVLDNTK